VSSGQNIIPFQRHAPEDPAALRRQLQEHLAQLEQIKAGSDALEVIRMTGLIGEEYRFLGEYVAALSLLEEALAGAQRLGARRLEVVNCIRLATAYQYMGRHDEAEALFRRALELAGEPGNVDRLDFALQHRGKCLVEMGRLEEAAACFEEALALRQAKGDAGLIASTEQALAAVRKRLARDIS
jgi:tetratricopeptide (TPR) repeat protein